MFFKLVDFKKLEMHLNAKQLQQQASLLFEKADNKFLNETLRQIGSKIQNTHEIESNPEKLNKEEGEEEGQYVVYANINSSDEDFSFLVTALYHWENLYPYFTLDLPKDPKEIVVKSKKQASSKEEDKKDEELKKEDKDRDKLFANIQEIESNTDL